MTVMGALRMLGHRVARRSWSYRPTTRGDAADALARCDGPAIVCAQAGNVNTGAFDPLDEIAAAAREHDAWVHVDGAFGLWAAASPALRTSPRARPTPTRGRPTRTSG